MGRGSQSPNDQRSPARRSRRSPQGKKAARSRLARAYATAGFEIVERPFAPPEVPWRSYRKPRGRDPEWLPEAKALVDQGLSAREVAEVIGARYQLRIHPSTMARILRDSGARLKGSAEPEDFVALRNREGVTEAWLVEKRSSHDPEDGPFDELIGQLAARRQRTMVAPMREAQPLWNDVDVVRHLCAKLNEFHASTQARAGGLSFEDLLVSAVAGTGKYAVDRYPVSNPGADIRLGMRDEQALTPYSLKSSRGRGKSGAKLEIQSLAPHGLGGVPRTVADVEAAVEAAIDHLNNYRNIAYLQAIETTFPDDPTRPAWRYNVIEVPHLHLRQALRNRTRRQLAGALRNPGRGGAIMVDVNDARGRPLFKVHIGATHVGITAIEPRFYRTQLSIWTAPPLEPPQPIGLAERQSFTNARKAKPARDRGPPPT